MLRAIVPLVICCLLACGGESPARLGVQVNSTGVEKIDIGPSPPELPKRAVQAASSLQADLLASDEPEEIRKLDAGNGVEIRDSAGQLISNVLTADYLTHFGAIEASRPGKKDLVLYTYPNDSRGGTFQVITPDKVTVGRWEESPATSHFDEGTWEGHPALFYLQREDLIVRSPTGLLLARLSTPSGMGFQQVHVGNAGKYLILLASGNGYTPFHMVCVFDAQQRLVFQELAEEHAFGLEVTEREFRVLARSRQWSYRLGSD